MPAEEIEIKIKIDTLDQLSRKLDGAKFRLITPRTHEINTLYDFSDGRLRARGEILRIRKYGSKWTLTHKTKGDSSKHKSRVETETELADGVSLMHIFEAIGLAPSFRYEKYRAEWSDGEGHVVIDETPIGNVAELEGAPEWIDRTAKTLAIAESEYITASYAQMFNDWKTRTGSKAANMTWTEIAK